MQVGAIGPRPSRARCYRQAAQILDLVQLDSSRHRILEENLASCLHNLRQSVPDKVLTNLRELKSWLHRKQADLAAEGSFGGSELSRWPAKIVRDLERPYSDAQVGRRVRQVSAAFERQVRALKKELPGYPRQFMAFGGVAHGRFGGNSDLDYLYCDPAGHSPFSGKPLADGFAFEPSDFRPRKSAGQAMGSPLVPLSGPAPWKAFEQLVRDQLQDRGLDVGEEWQVSRVAYPRQVYEDRSTPRERAMPCAG
ncbi:MAG: hypothetical protein AMXMBFR33_37960 [Candidatus Xenobia bacterium]